jgi:hypothetical protein
MTTLHDFTDVLYAVFERSVADTNSYFQSRTKELHGEEIDPRPEPHAYSMLVRYIACELFVGGEYSSVPYRFERLPNNGMRFEHGGYEVRVWKADDGELPAPGPSRSRQDYYQQPLFADLSPKKLAVLWESLPTGAVTLILACPKGDGEPWQSGQSHWEVTIPHPASNISGAQQAPGADSAQNDDFDDLRFNEETGEGGDD